MLLMRADAAAVYAYALSAAPAAYAQRRAYTRHTRRHA